MDKTTFRYYEPFTVPTISGEGKFVFQTSFRPYDYPTLGAGPQCVESTTPPGFSAVESHKEKLKKFMVGLRIPDPDSFLDLPGSYLEIIGRQISDQLLMMLPKNNVQAGVYMKELPKNDDA